MDNNLKKQTICRCSSCGNTFDYTETREVDYWLYGKQLIKKLCPYCSSESFSPSEIDYFYDKLGKNKKFN